jgi:hypothetical protein
VEILTSLINNLLKFNGLVEEAVKNRVDIAPSAYQAGKQFHPYK